MILADRTVLDKLSPLQAKVLAHIGRFCLADVVLAKDGRRFTCRLARIPREKLNHASEAEYKASALALAPDHLLALERDIPLAPVARPIVLDKWPEKQFCHPERFPGESSRSVNCCPLDVSGEKLDEALTALLDLLELLFDGWHLALEDECDGQYSMKSYRAMWQDEVDVQQCLEELEAERNKSDN